MFYKRFKNPEARFRFIGCGGSVPEEKVFFYMQNTQMIGIMLFIQPVICTVHRDFMLTPLYKIKVMFPNACHRQSPWCTDTENIRLYLSRVLLFTYSLIQ